MSNPLLNNLDELVANNVITADIAQQIRLYYGNRKSSSNRFPTVLAILGALLLGSGLVLVIAHNWDMLSRLSRTIIAFFPLVIGQALCVYSFLRKRDNRAWNESSSVFLFFAVATSISLISQIYQVNGELHEFLLTWILLAIPLVYVMSSGVISLLLIALATWYGSLVGYSQSDPPYQYLFIMALLSPNYIWYFKKSFSNFFHLHNWFSAISFLIVLGAFIHAEYDNAKWIFMAYMGLLSIYYLLGDIYFKQQRSRLADPFKIIGAAGIITIFLLWSFEWVWTPMSTTIHSFIYLPIGFFVLCGYLIFRQYKKEKQVDLLSFSPFVFAIGVLAFYNNNFFGILLFNLWILAIGIYYIRKGNIRDHLGYLNFGLLLIALLAVFRFFDNNIPFIWRGLMFIVTGVGFFLSNIMLIRRRRTASTKNTTS